MTSAAISLLYAWILLPLVTTGRDNRGYSDGQACVFPFAYKGRTFYTCTNEDDNLERFWCATTGSLDKNNKWTYCTDTSTDFVEAYDGLGLDRQVVFVDQEE